MNHRNNRPALSAGRVSTETTEKNSVFSAKIFVFSAVKPKLIGKIIKK